MASPAVGTTNSGFRDTTATSHTISYPASAISAGDTLLCFFAHKDTANGATYPAGWTKFNEILFATGSGAALAPGWRKADGTEDGTTFSITTVVAARMAYTIMTITGAADPSVTAPTSQAGATLANTVNPNPPNCNPAVSKDFLFLAAMASSHGRVSTAVPTNYTLVANGGSNSGTATAIGTASAWRQLTASSDDPAAFTTGGTAVEETCSQTIAVHPAAAVAAGPFILNQARDYA